MASPVVAVPEKTRAELLAVRSLVESLLANGSIPHDSAAVPKTIKKFLTRHLDKKPKKCRPPSVYRPRDDNTTVYAPRQLDLVRQFLACLKANPGELMVRTSNPSEVYTAKLMSVKFIDKIAPRVHGDDETRRRRVSLSLAIVHACARLVETMEALVREHPERFDGARFAMQQSHATPGWNTKCTMGTGVALNGPAETTLLPAAIAKVESQLSGQQALLSPEFVDDGSGEGSESKGSSESGDD
jgi:hypothetical protein